MMRSNFLTVLLFILCAVTFQKVCTVPECGRFVEGPRQRYCRDCGNRVSWWWNGGCLYRMLFF